MPSRPRVLVVLNPVHPPSADARHALATSADASGIELVERQTSLTEPGDGLVADASGFDRVIVVGGDGTVRAVAGALGGTGTTLAIVPTGTANLFARNIGLDPRSPLGAIDLALTGTPRPLDLGRATITGEGGWSAEVPFLVVAGMGNDAATVLSTSDARKRRVRWLAYFESGARHLLAPSAPYVVRLDGDPRELTAWSVLIGNAGRLPLGATFAPDARPDDGFLHLCAATPTSVAGWAQIGARGVLRWRGHTDALVEATASEISITPSAPTAVQLDGDPLADITDLRARIEPGALMVVTGKA